jgi:hypothetical protein
MALITTRWLFPLGGMIVESLFFLKVPRSPFLDNFCVNHDSPGTDSMLFQPEFT